MPPITSRRIAPAVLLSTLVWPALADVPPPAPQILQIVLDDLGGLSGYTFYLYPTSEAGDSVVMKPGVPVSFGYTYISHATPIGDGSHSIFSHSPVGPALFAVRASSPAARNRAFFSDPSLPRTGELGKADFSKVRPHAPDELQSQPPHGLRFHYSVRGISGATVRVELTRTQSWSEGQAPPP